MQVSKIEKFPKEKHYAAIEFDSVWIEGDERSRTHPGHGYPGHYKDIVSYIHLGDKEALDNYITKKEMPNYGTPQRNYVIIEAQKVEPKIKIEIKV